MPSSPHPPRPIREPLIDTKEAARLLDVSPGYLEHARVRGGGPPFVVVSRRRIRYRPEALAAWIAARERSSTADPR
jgi:hypothetical protein